MMKRKSLFLIAFISLVFLGACSSRGSKEASYEKKGCCKKAGQCERSCGEKCKKGKKCCNKKDKKKKKQCSKNRAMQSAPLTQEEMMKAMQESATPGIEHARLEPLVGNWAVTVKFWMSEDAKPEVSYGTSRTRWVLGKRFIQEDFSGKWMGKPFTGLGMLGYDKVKGSYTSSWIDNMGTGMMNSYGSFNDSVNQLEMWTRFHCPVAGKKKGKSVTTIIGKNEHVFEMFEVGKGGVETRVMEIRYKRKSAKK